MLKSNVEISGPKSVDENVGEHIGLELGVKMVKDYYETYGESGSQFVGKNILEDILKQPGCIGINIFKALNEMGQKTYVIVGLDKENNPILNYSVVNSIGEINKKEGIVADRNFGMGWFDEVIKRFD